VPEFEIISRNAPKTTPALYSWPCDIIVISAKVGGGYVMPGVYLFIC